MLIKEPTESKLAILTAEKERIEREVREVMKNTEFLCDATPIMRWGKTYHGCGEMSKMRDLTLVILKEYVPPYGCSEGDYYRVHSYGLRCPKCTNLVLLPEETQEVNWAQHCITKREEIVL